MKTIIQDYNPNQAVEPAHPDAPELVPPRFLDKLARLITLAEEMSQEGEFELDSDEFFNRRGLFLDALNDTEVADWLTSMRKVNRCPFRRYRITGG